MSKNEANCASSATQRSRPRCSSEIQAPRTKAHRPGPLRPVQVQDSRLNPGQTRYLLDIVRRAAQVTDAHLHSLGPVENAIIEAVREHDVQLVALTGDLVDSTELLSTLTSFLHELGTTKAQVVASLGNWEHWGKIPSDDLSKTYREAGATLLVNESLDFAGVQVLATDDSTGGRPEFSLEARRGARPRVLLTHSPELLDRFPTDAGRMALSLAGHTHGGQVRLGSSLVPFRPPGSGRFIAGWYETLAGRAYVSRGTGTSILPLRFSCRPELPIFRLRQA